MSLNNSLILDVEGIYVMLSLAKSNKKKISLDQIELEDVLAISSKLEHSSHGSIVLSKLGIEASWSEKFNVD